MCNGQRKHQVSHYKNDYELSIYSAEPPLESELSCGRYQLFNFLDIFHVLLTEQELLLK